MIHDHEPFRICSYCAAGQHDDCLKYGSRVLVSANANWRDRSAWIDCECDHGLSEEE